MFNINMNMFETFEVTFEVYVGDTLTNKQTMQAPKEILMMNFMQTMKQVGNDKRPIKIKMLRPETFWDSFERKERVHTHEVSFSNNAMIAWEEDKQRGGV